MDALRKAEEAKKKAELDSKSKSDPVLAQTDAVDEFDEVQTGFETLQKNHPLLEDLSADNDLPGKGSGARENRTSPYADEIKASPGKLDSEDAAKTGLDEFFALDSGSKTELEASSQKEAESATATELRRAASQFPDYTNAVDFLTQDQVETDTHSAEFSDSEPEPEPEPERPAAVVAKAVAAGRNSRPVDVGSSGIGQPAVPVSKAGSHAAGTKGVRAQRAAREPAIEEQQRKSAKNIFAAKRNQSALKKNMQVTALGVAAVLIVAIGIYFYINLRTGSGIGTPLAEMDYQQSQRQYTEAELELGDADLGIAAVEPVNTDTQPENARLENVIGQDPVISPPGNPVVPVIQATTADADFGVAEPEIVAASPVQTPFESQTAPAIETVADAPTIAPASNRPADTATGTTNNPASVATAEVTAVSATASNTVSTSVGNDEPLVENAPQISAALATTTATGFSGAAVGSTAIAQPENFASAAATLQPHIIQPEALVSFTRRVTAPAGNSLIENAYIAYQNGNFEQAEQLYREALTDAPLNRGALLGLAAIAASRNDTVAALDLYSRLLARDPNDPVARAGILEIMPGGTPQQQETELRRLQELNPDVAPLAYAFGNFLASQQRWSEAQQAYFSALQLAKNDARISSVNPDYAFNLAVSLEHLGQSRSAGNYYREALSLAESHPAGFDPDLARERLSRMELAPNE